MLQIYLSKWTPTGDLSRMTNIIFRGFRHVMPTAELMVGDYVHTREHQRPTARAAKLGTCLHACVDVWCAQKCECFAS
jgi:hypothetical protein